MILTPAEQLAYHMLKFPDTRWAILASDMRIATDICLTALVDALYVQNIAARTGRRLHLRNESRVTAFSGDRPDVLRGPQFHGAWIYQSEDRIREETLFNLSMASKLILPGVDDADQHPVFS